MGQKLKRENTDKMLAGELDDDETVDFIKPSPEVWSPPDGYWFEVAKVLIRWAMMPHHITGVIQAVRRAFGQDGVNYFGMYVGQVRPELVGVMRAVATTANSRVQQGIAAQEQRLLLEQKQQEARAAKR